MKVLDELLDLKAELKALKSIKDDDGTRIPAEEVIGHSIPDEIDLNDGCE